jgi:hypothetical protein
MKICKLLWYRVDRCSSPQNTLTLDRIRYGHYRVILLTSSSTCGICGGQSGTDTVCLQVLLFPPLTIIICASYISHYISEATDRHTDSRVFGEPKEVTTGTRKFVLCFRAYRCWVRCSVVVARTNQTARKCTGDKAQWIGLAKKC